MSYYTECKLTLWGITTAAEFEELETLLAHPHKGNLVDASLDFFEDEGSPGFSSKFYSCDYDDVEGGKMDDQTRLKIEMLGLSYEWSWKDGEELDGGVIVYDAESGETYEFTADREAEITLTLPQLDCKIRDWLGEARRCQKLRDQAAKIKLTAAGSAHEEMEAIARIKGLQTQVQGDNQPEPA